MGYETVIGLEVHVQLKTRSKIFCGCSTEFGALPNTHTCPVCTGMPGVLPLLNKKVVEHSIRVSLALNCDVMENSVFARKNYFYPDLPKNYQISQYDMPVGVNGHLDIELDSKTKRIGITRIHLEEDAGKLLHSIGSRSIDGSLVDLNRTGVPLLEIVSEPDMRSPQEAYQYMLDLKMILQYIGVSECNMEEGSLRCDANISLRPVGQKELGVKVELKNMNSFKNVLKALEYEVKRQSKVLGADKKIFQETRLWDQDNQKSISMRGKEEAHDYRYFPEPDLLPVHIEDEWIDTVRRTLSELPQERRNRFIQEYRLSDYDARVLTSYKPLADYYEQCLDKMEQLGDELVSVTKLAANWVTGDLLGCLNAENKKIGSSPVTAGHLANMLHLLQKKTISGKIAKKVFEEMYKTSREPAEIVEEMGLTQIIDEDMITKFVVEVINENASSVEEYRKGREKVIGFLIGAVMKKALGKANPALVNKVLRSKLKS